jgi:peptidoglycan/LPS O-acetylase OafA/YrhL
MLLPVLVYEFTVPIASQCPELLNILFIPGAFLLILAAAGAELDGSAHWLQHRFMVRLGDASFALYMIHALLLGLFAAAIQRYFDALFFSSRFVESIFATGFVLFAIAASVLVHNGFEHPVRIALLRLKS